MNLILASASPRRKELLSLITKDFTIIPATGEEHINNELPPDERVKALAVQKASEVAEKHPDSIVIGADTMVFLGDIALGKPKDVSDAKRMLSLLSGKTHTVITAVAVAKNGIVSDTFADSTQVEFYPLSEYEIDAYIKSGEPMDKAGAYGIQEKGALLVKGIKGDYYNVMGLPAARLYRTLSQYGATEFCL